MVNFIELVQVAIGVRDELSRIPSDAEWDALFAEALHQGLIGITYVGVRKLVGQPGYALPNKLLLKWSGAAFQLKDQNAHVSAQGERVLRYFRDAGFQAIILKGQSHLPNYPEELHELRAPGDIDVWVKGGCRKLVFLFVHNDYPDAEYTYLHIHLPVFSDTSVEIHYRPSYLFNPFFDHRLQQWAESIDLETLLNERMFRNFNAIFQPLHLYRHLAWEGISIRQLLDYYFLLKQRPEIDYDILKRLGMCDFQKDLSEVVYHLFEDKPLSSFSARKLLDDILIYGKLGSNPIKRTRYRILHLSKFYSKDILWMPLAQLYHNLWCFYARLFY